jgi:hypothetical protein
MSSSASRPPGASPRKLVLRRKANAPSLPSPGPPDVFDSKVSRLTAGRPLVSSPYSRRAEPSGAMPPPIPPAGGLPRDLWPDAPQESPVHTGHFTPPPPPPHLPDPSAHLSPPPPAHLPQTLVRESVLPTVATVTPAGLGGDLAPVAAQRAGRNFFPATAAVSVMLVVAAGWLGARWQHAAPAAARAVPPSSAMPIEAPPPQQAAQPPSESHDTVPTTDIDALPKAQPVKTYPFAGAPRAVHNGEPSAASAAAPAPAPKDNLAINPAASASAHSAAAAASASADAPDPLLDNAPSTPPTVDPLVKAVQQDIADEQHK